MKKFIITVSCVLIALVLSASCVAAVEWAPDFDEYMIDATNIGIDFAGTKTAESKYFAITEDPQNADNHVLKLSNDATTVARYMQLKGDYSGRTEVSFKMLINSGRLNMYFRDSAGTENNLAFFNATPGNIKIGYNTNTSFDSSKWVTVKLVLDMKYNNTIYLYTDIANGYNGELSLSSQVTFASAFGDAYTNHVKNNTNLRIGPMDTVSEVYVDDFAIKEDKSLKNILSVTNIKAYKEILGENREIKALRDGKITLTADISNTSVRYSQDAMLAFALYSKDGMVKNMAVAEKVTLEYGTSQTVSAVMNITSLAEGDYLKAFLFDGEENVVPLATVKDILQNELYFRPSMYEITKTLTERYPTEESHPRLVRTAEDFAEIRSYIQNDAYYQGLLEEFKENAEQYFTIATPTYEYSSDGNLLQEARNVKNAVLNLGYLYNISETEAERLRYAEGVWRMVGPACDPEIFPDWAAEDHYLDTGEMAFGVALAYDWLYDYWTADQKKAMEDALYNYIIVPSLEVFEGKESYFGVFANSNWNSVCNGGSLAAAIAIFEKYPEECAELISYSTEAIELCLPAYAPDGGYGESTSYWNYGTTYLVWCMSMLDTAFGDMYGLDNAPGLDVTGYFPTYITMPTGSWSYNDTSTGLFTSSAASSYIADIYNDSEMATLRHELINNGIYEHEISVDVKDMLFYRPDLINGSFDVNTLDHSRLYEGIGTAVMRESFTDKSALYAGLHGGDNNVNHGDLDAGNFIIGSMGEEFITELTADDYVLDGYFSLGVDGRRWQYYKKNAEGQNTIIIADDSTIPYGQRIDAVAPITAFEVGDYSSYALTDMTPVLGAKVTDATRGLFFSEARGEVIVQDEISFSEATDMYWVAHTSNATITVDEDGKRAVIEKNGKRMEAFLITDNDALVFETMGAYAFLDATAKGEDGKEVTGARGTRELNRDAYKKLYIHADGVTEFNVAVVFRMQVESDFVYEYVPFENWSNDNVPMAYADMIYVNGEEVAGFDKATETYEKVVRYDEEVVVTASVSDDFNYEIEELDDVYTITVTGKYSTSLKTVYTVAILREPEQIEDGNYAKYNVVSVEASSEPEADQGHTADKAVDNDLTDDSRWASDEAGATLTIDLGEECAVEGVAIKFYNAHRNFYFDILYSTDGATFTPYALGLSSSGLVSGEEIIKFAEAVNAQYIRYVGYGNNENAWNSLIEFSAVYKKVPVFDFGGDNGTEDGGEM